MQSHTRLVTVGAPAFVLALLFEWYLAKSYRWETHDYVCDYWRKDGTLAQICRKLGLHRYWENVPAANGPVTDGKMAQMVRGVFGAVVVDSAGDMGAVRTVMLQLGILAEDSAGLKGGGSG